MPADVRARTYRKCERMRRSAGSGCKCTADTAYWAMDAAAGGYFFVIQSATILGHQRVASKYKEVAVDSNLNFHGWCTSIMQRLSYLLGQNIKIHQKPLPPSCASGKYCIPSTCLLTVHTALGLPGSSETAISDT